MKKYVTWMWFKFWPMINIFWKLLANKSLVTTKLPRIIFAHRIHSNSKEVPYISWQSKYSNLKTTCHIKSNFSYVWTKLLQNLLHAKYIIIQNLLQNLSHTNPSLLSEIKMERIKTPENNITWKQHLFFS